MIDYSSPDEVVKHLKHIKTTYGVDYNNPFSATKTKYTISLYYLGNLFYHLDTKCFDKTIDDFLKEGDNDEKRK